MTSTSTTSKFKTLRRGGATTECGGHDESLFRTGFFKISVLASKRHLTWAVARRYSSSPNKKLHVLCVSIVSTFCCLRLKIRCPPKQGHLRLKIQCPPKQGHLRLKIQCPPSKVTCA